MMPLKKGQSAIEYMMTYGWAILVIMIVGIVMWQMGIFEFGKSVNPGKNGFSQITLLDHTASKGEGKIKLVVVNDAGTRLTLNSVTATMINGGTGACSSDFTSPTDMLPAGTFLVNLTCTFVGNVGDYYRAEVNIDYTNPASELGHNSVGKIWGPME